MTYLVNDDRYTQALSNFKDETLDCLANNFKRIVNAYASDRRFPPAIKTAIITRFTANIINSNLPLLMLYREESIFDDLSTKRTSSIGYRYYLAIPDPTYTISYVDWVGRAIDKTLTVFRVENNNIVIVPGERSQFYPFDNNSYNNIPSVYIQGNFSIVEKVEV